MLDTFVGDTDRAPFDIPGVGRTDKGIRLSGSSIPDYWFGYDNLSKPSAIVEGVFTDDSKPNILEFSNWGKYRTSTWDHEINNDASNGDSCVIMYWDNELLPFEYINISTYYAVSSVEGVINNPYNVVSLYRYCKKNSSVHFYTTNYNELGEGALGYVLESRMCSVYPKQVNGTVPLYRYCKDGTDEHTYTTNYSKYGNGKGTNYTYEGVQCYVYKTQVSGTRPLYRYVRNDGVTFLTTDYNELKSGALNYKYDGIECYVL